MSNKIVEQLSNAAVVGNVDKFNTLLNDLPEAVNINGRDQFGDSPMHLAAREGHLNILRVMASPKWISIVDTEIRNAVSHTPLHTAANAGRLDAVRFLIAELSANVNAFDENDYSALHLAAASGRKDVVVALLDEFNVDVDLSVEGKTALHCAAQFGYEKVVQCLLARSANVDAVEKRFQSTPLALATFNQHTQTVMALLSAKADMSLQNCHGKSALELAEMASSELLHIFQQFCDVDERDEQLWDNILADVDGTTEIATSASTASDFEDIVQSMSAIHEMTNQINDDEQDDDDARDDNDTVVGGGSITLVGSGPGGAGLLTVAGKEALLSADVVVADELVPDSVVALCKGEFIQAKKHQRGQDPGQQDLNIAAVAALKAGKKVVRLKSGDPFLYGRGGEEILFYRGQGFEPAIVPGVTSALAAPGLVGIPVTHRGIANQVLILTAHGRKGAFPDIPPFLASRTLVFLMVVKRLSDITLQCLIAEMNYPSNLPAALIVKAATPDEKVFIGTLSTIGEICAVGKAQSPATLVVGHAVNATRNMSNTDMHEDVVVPRKPDEKPTTVTVNATNRPRFALRAPFA